MERTDDEIVCQGLPAVWCERCDGQGCSYCLGEGFVQKTYRGVRSVTVEPEHVRIELDTGSIHKFLKQPGYTIERMVQLAKDIEAHNELRRQD